MKDEHHSQFDFSQVTETIFLGTNLCCLTRSHIQILLDIGIAAEIDLEKERQDAAPDVEVYLWLPVADKTAPTLEQFVAGVIVMEEMSKRGKKVYVHCQYGHGRSPTMVAAYLISQGKTVLEAIDTVKKARPEIHIEDVQVTALENYYKSVNT
jgi:protein-tyrosine phosphatase